MTNREHAEQLIDAARKELLGCNTVTAKALYLQAADRLADYHDADDKAISMLKLAEVYMESGDWHSAYYSLKKVSKSKLSAENLAVHKQWVDDVTSHLAMLGKKGVIVDDLVAQQKWTEVIEMLQDDPYVVTPFRLAQIRSMACKALGLKEAAELFAKDADRLAGERITKPFVVKPRSSQQSADLLEWQNSNLQVWQNGSGFVAPEL